MSGYGKMTQRTDCCYVRFIGIHGFVLVFKIKFKKNIFFFSSLSAGRCSGPCKWLLWIFLCVCVDWWSPKRGVLALLPSSLPLHSNAVSIAGLCSSWNRFRVPCAESTVLWHSPGGRCTASLAICCRQALKYPDHQTLQTQDLAIFPWRNDMFGASNTRFFPRVGRKQSSMAVADLWGSMDLF